MYDLKVYSSYIVTAIKDKVVFFSAESGAVLHEIIIEQKAPAKDSNNDKQSKAPPANVVTFEYCSTAKVLVVSLSDKTLQCYQLCDNEPGRLKSKPLGENAFSTPRTIVCMKFAPKHGVLFGTDKSDCFELDVLGRSEQTSKWILGHMSQILALAISEDERFIITGDRDEKIKVSSYPDCYNIECFCLGHFEYVAGIEVISSDKLISASGDRTLRLWDFTVGKEMCKLTLKEPALALTTQKVTDSDTVLCAMRSYAQNKVEVAIVSYDKPEASLVYDNLTIAEGLTILSVAFSAPLQLMLLTMEKESKRVRLLVYDFCVEQKHFMAHSGHPLTKNFEHQFNGVTIELERDYSTLFKHTCDNLTEYFERKKIKMETKKKSK